MSATINPELCALLAENGQSHLVAACEKLPGDRQAAFRKQLRSVDWPQLRRLFQNHKQSLNATSQTAAGAAHRAMPPKELIRLPSDEQSADDWTAATVAGEKLLAAGRVAAVVVAGGQGTRLGFDQPKGLFPIGPLSGKTLFQWFSEQLQQRERRSGCTIPYIVMTSDATHDQTVDFFVKQQFFGRSRENVWFVCQGKMAAVDAETGAALLVRPDELAFSPDGHGGLLDALERSGRFQDMADRGIDQIFYHQVDNPTTKVCDPAFLGWHELRHADVSTKVVRKVNAAEKMGVAVDIDGITQIIEYSDLPSEISEQVDADGELKIWAGNTAIHAFRREFLETVCRSPEGLPFHVAHKAVPFLNEAGEEIAPKSPNAYKFERFIFDVLPAAKTALIVEADRLDEFNPVKNATGADSPATSRAALIALHRQWLTKAGITVAEGVEVEISPLLAINARELQEHASDLPQSITESVVLE